MNMDPSVDTCTESIAHSSYTLYQTDFTSKHGLREMDTVREVTGTSTS